MQNSNRCLINAKSRSKWCRSPAVWPTCPLPSGFLQRCLNLLAARWWAPAALAPAADPALSPRHRNVLKLSAGAWESPAPPALKQRARRACWHSTISLLLTGGWQIAVQFSTQSLCIHDFHLSYSAVLSQKSRWIQKGRKSAFSFLQMLLCRTRQ